MMYWATLYYAGKVLVAFGGMPLEECNTLTALMIADTNTAYQEQTDTLADSMFPTNQFSVECETTKLPIHPKYAQ